ncbi:LytR/AlgR family response regulator transcription factor [Fluviicola sp.]|uniref:LytR/AlgR family response regulator transcription factor n=1 Tax=Fluviicola sp. TaxID=1917219 RepID=UPI003D2B8313
MINCVIVEDEIAGQQILLNKLKTHFPECEVLAIIDNKVEAIQFINANPSIDLVFLDVQIKGGTGIDVLSSIENKTFEAIFVTAFDQYAIDALNASASYYLLKPIRDETFKKGVSLVLSKINKSSVSNTLLIPYKGSYNSIKYDDIIYFESDGAYTNVITKHERILSSKNLGYYEKILPKEQFKRSHHSYVVNVKHMELLIKSRTGILRMITGKEIPIAQRRMQEFMHFLQEQ